MKQLKQHLRLVTPWAVIVYLVTIVLFLVGREQSAYRFIVPIFIGICFCVLVLWLKGRWHSIYFKVLGYTALLPFGLFLCMYFLLQLINNPATMAESDPPFQLVTSLVTYTLDYIEWSVWLPILPITIAFVGYSFYLKWRLKNNLTWFSGLLSELITVAPYQVYTLVFPTRSLTHQPLVNNIKYIENHFLTLFKTHSSRLKCRIAKQDFDSFYWLEDKYMNVFDDTKLKEAWHIIERFMDFIEREKQVYEDTEVNHRNPENSKDQRLHLERIWKKIICMCGKLAFLELHRCMLKENTTLSSNFYALLTAFRDYYHLGDEQSKSKALFNLLEGRAASKDEKLFSQRLREGLRNLEADSAPSLKKHVNFDALVLWRTEDWKQSKKWNRHPFFVGIILYLWTISWGSRKPLPDILSKMSSVGGGGQTGQPEYALIYFSLWRLYLKEYIQSPEEDVDLLKLKFDRHAVLELGRMYWQATQ